MQGNALKTTSGACACGRVRDDALGPAPRAGRMARLLLCCILSLALAASGLPGGLFAPQTAFADTTDIEAEADEAQQEVERTAEEYNEATARVEELEQEISDNEAKIDEIEAQLPEQQEKGAEACRQLYQLQRNAAGLLEMILSIDDFNDFLTTIEYLDHIQQSSMDDLEALQTSREELEETQAALEEAQTEAEEEEEESSSETIEAASSDNADWSSDKSAFVEEWAARIDAYLAGSAMAGTGEYFAEAAWDYGVDPRWSPAIAYTESSLGAHCSYSYNAWGWGSVSWSSWEAAINDHVAGLARGYGYTISVTAAKKYCPANWENWYNTTSAQMAMI